VTAEIRLKADQRQYFRAFSEVTSERPHEFPVIFPVSRELPWRMVRVSGIAQDVGGTNIGKGVCRWTSG
jgi:hypothetical protein